MYKKKILLFVAALAMFAPWTASAQPSPDTLIKGSGSAVYYYASDGKRYVFPNQKTYESWFSDFSGIRTVSNAELATIPLGKNVTYRPGIRMIKVQTDPKVYAVAPGGTLRWVKTESLAEDLYGEYWKAAIDDLSDAFFTDYVVGEPITRTEDFKPLQVAESTDTINADKGIPVSALPRRSDTEVSSIVDAWRAFALEDINAHRKRFNKPPLIMNPLLNRIATIHSRDMALHDRFDHTGSLGETADDRIRLGKVPDLASGTFMTVPHPDDVDWTGENLGTGTMRNRPDSVEETIAKIHELFLDEPPDEPNHRTTMLSTLHPYSEIGIGPYVKGDTLWLTEDFISR